MGKYTDLALKTYEELQRRKKQKMYDQRIMNNDIIEANIRSIEKNQGRKLGQR